jgi:preprotein translocase subunit YajC
VRPENLLLLVLLGGLLLLMFNRTRKQQREAQQVQTDLVVGAQVMTTAGLYATVVELDDASVLLETSPGQHSRWDRRAVARILSPEEAAPAVAAADSNSESDSADVGTGMDIGKGAGARGKPEGDGEDGPPSDPGTAPPSRG